MRHHGAWFWPAATALLVITSHGHRLAVRGLLARIAQQAQVGFRPPSG